MNKSEYEQIKKEIDKYLFRFEFGSITDKMNKNELKLLPCPFCGSKYVQVRYINNPFDKQHIYGGYRGECSDCYVLTKPCKTEQEAIENWNGRFGNEGLY